MDIYGPHKTKPNYSFLKRHQQVGICAALTTAGWILIRYTNILSSSSITK